MANWTTYARRKIRLNLRLGQGGFDATSFDTITIEGLRVVANISKVVAPSTAMAVIRVFGLTLDHINQLTAAGSLWGNRLKNFVALEAGDDFNGMTIVFNGIIQEAYPDFTSQPDTAFVIIAHAATGIKINPVRPTSLKGGNDARTVFGQIAQKAGVQLEENGVQGQLDNPYLPGTAWNQAILAGKAFNCFVYYDDLADAIAVWPKTGKRPGQGSTFTVSADTGMIGYPMFQNASVTFRTLFDPSVRFGHSFLAETQFTAANGSWVVRQLDYALTSEMPNGPWEMIITTYKEGYG